MYAKPMEQLSCVFDVFLNFTVSARPSTVASEHMRTETDIAEDEISEQC